MKEVKYPMPNNTYNKGKAKVITDFTFMDNDYSKGDILDIAKASYGDFDLVMDGKNCICDVDSAFFENRFEIVGKVKIKTEDIDYNNIKLTNMLNQSLAKEIMRLSLKWNIKQAEQIVNKCTDKLDFTNEVIIHRGIELCAKEILEVLDFFSDKEMKKEFGIEEGI